MKFRTALMACALGATLLVQPAAAQKSADTLRVVFRDTVTNVDPYFNQLRTGVVISHQAWEGSSTAIPTRSRPSRCSPPPGSSSTTGRSSSSCAGA